MTIKQLLIAATLAFTATTYASEAQINIEVLKAQTEQERYQNYLKLKAEAEAMAWVSSQCKTEVKVYGKEGLLKENCTKFLEKTKTFDKYVDLHDQYVKFGGYKMLTIKRDIYTAFENLNTIHALAK